MKPFQPHADGESRRRSVTALVRMVLAVDDPVVLQKHKRDLLDCLLWKYTEADGKHNTRHRSRLAHLCPQKSVRSDLSHDHVFTKERMIDDLVAGGVDGVENVLANAIGCLVTKDEHRDLSQHDKDFQGWERYAKAGIELHSDSK